MAYIHRSKESAARLPTTLSVTALDAAPVIISVARAHASKDPSLTPQKLTYINTTIESFTSSPSTTQPFDVVTLFEVIEHVDSPATFLSHLSSALMYLFQSCVPLGTMPRMSSAIRLVVNQEVQGVVYVPGLGWKEVDGSEKVGNYFIV